jgi:hypothetical protein
MKQALKEWSIAIEALEQGDTILLLRKGGIRESNGRFEVPFDRVLLYPTFEHQDPALLKQPNVDRVESGWHPETVKISSIANITHVLQVSDPEVVHALLPFHVWNERFVEERLKWKPRSPLYLLLLRVSRLEKPQVISYQEAYGGCRSWIEIEEIDIDRVQPVLSEGEYVDRVKQIHNLISQSQSV